MNKTLLKITTLLAILPCACALGGHWRYTAQDSATFIVPSCPGWKACVPFPTKSSGQTLNGMQWNQGALTLGNTLSVPFEIVSAAGTTYASTNGETPPFRLTLMLDRKDDTEGNVNYRFYCGQYILGTASDNTTQTLSCPLSPSVWTNVDGQQNEAAFNDVVLNLESINVCFGGVGGDCHGLAVDAGSATIDLGKPSD